MGTSNKQIATRANVNSKRLGAFVTGTSAATYMKKCVTKKAVTDIQYLDVNDRIATISANPLTTSLNDYFGADDRSSMNIQQQGAGQYSSVVTDANITVSDNTVYCLTQAYTYNTSSYPASVDYTCVWPGTASDAKYCALYKRTITVPTNLAVSVSVSLTAFGVQNDAMTGIGGMSKYYNINRIAWYPGFIITDSSDSTIIATRSPVYSSSTTFTDSFNFTTSYSSINIYFMASTLSMSFYPNFGEDYTGFGITCNVNLTYNESKYDQTYKLAQYQDIAAKGGTFSCSYYIYNNKSSNAKLDWVKCYVGATSDPLKGTWTEVGSVSQGTVNSTASGSVTCSIPSSKISSTQQWFHVRCGYTNANQNWYGGWGTGGANSNASTSCGKQTWGYTPAVPLTSPTGAAAVLNYNLIRTTEGASMGYIVKGIYGQTTTRHALFRIT